MPVTTSKVPLALEHRARALMYNGHDSDSAWAIATAASQREGRLRPGTHKLTSKGRSWEAAHAKEAQTHKPAIAKSALKKVQKPKPRFDINQQSLFDINPSKHQIGGARLPDTPHIPGWNKKADLALLPDRDGSREAADIGRDRTLLSRPETGHHIPLRERLRRVRTAGTPFRRRVDIGNARAILGHPRDEGQVQ